MKIIIFIVGEKEQEIYINIHKVENFNLLMGITLKKLIGFSIKDKAVDSSYFFEFIEEVVKNIDANEINKYIFFIPWINI